MPKFFSKNGRKFTAFVVEVVLFILVGIADFYAKKHGFVIEWTNKVMVILALCIGFYGGYNVLDTLIKKKTEGSEL